MRVSITTELFSQFFLILFQERKPYETCNGRVLLPRSKLLPHVDPMFSVDSWIKTLHPVGAIGVLLKSKLPSTISYADIFGSIVDGQSKLSIIVAISNNLHHK